MGPGTVTGQPVAQQQQPDKLADGCMSKVLAFIVTHFLLLSFVVALAVALAWPAPGVAALHVEVLNNVHILQELGMGVVFFISGLTLDTQELCKVKGNVWSVLFGFASILVITPCLGFAMREVPLQPTEFTIGLMVFCIVPTTLGVGVALVRACQGNEAIALMLIVATNLLGVFTMPLWLKLLFLNAPFALASSFTVDIPNLLVKLLITIVAPSVIGKVLREVWAPALRFSKQYKTCLSITSTICLAFIIWMTLSGARDLLFEAKGGMIAAVIVLGIAIHMFYLGFNYLVVCMLFRTSLAEATALVIISSQKSAPVAVTLISYATSVASQQGLLAIPAIVGQLSQIFIGSALVPIVLLRVKAARERELELHNAAPLVETEDRATASTALAGTDKSSDGGAGADAGSGCEGGTDPVNIEFVTLELGQAGCSQPGYQLIRGSRHAASFGPQKDAQLQQHLGLRRCSGGDEAETNGAGQHDVARNHSQGEEQQQPHELR